ncbi:DinB family protein [Deinococcus hohokamensis]|uniref:DinB family protein n=1 Tax=Deinococcus hohokamensis TaxID=309883 RepID=A0ABV9I9M1_9DEIO
MGAPQDRPQPELPHQYPVGRLPQLPDERRVQATLHEMADDMNASVQAWEALLSGRRTDELARTYRPGAWTVQQLAHHTADAHFHGLNRLRNGLTSERYVIQPFNQQAVMALPDYALPVAEALHLLHALDTRWAALLRGVNPSEFARRVVHPAEGEQDLWQLATKHEWHLRHHLAQARVALGHAG